MFFTISGGAMVILSWNDLVVPMVGCHLASKSRKRGPRGDLAQVILKCENKKSGFQSDRNPT